MMKKLAEYAGTRKKVRLTRNRPSATQLNGYILGVSDALVLMHPFDDFEPDGYAVIRVGDITHLRRCPYEQWWDHMLQGEGLLDGLNKPPQIDLSDMRSAVLGIASRYDQMIVHCEDAEENVQDFYLGKLIGAEGNAVKFLGYDGLGYWAETPDEIPIADITMLEFDTPYIRIFSKYTREGTPPEFPEY